VGERLVLPVEQGRVSVTVLLDELGRRRMTNVLVEGGAEVLGSFFEARAVDEVWVFVAPRIIGGQGKSAIGGLGVSRLADSLRLKEWGVEQVEEDVLLHGWA
jgi:diaminohydroxyphosphoribosylaminopyrimidine deaminase / 5-amino-6-(5-phosphoribosylamino)uracil reductase